MKNTILFILMSLIIFTCQASNIEFYWVKAMKYCNERNYDQGEIFFDLAVEEMEKEKQQDKYPHIYLNRGKLYYLLERYEEAFKDIDKSISYETLSKHDRLKAVFARGSTYYKLGMEKECLEDIKYFNDNYICKPDVSFSYEFIIIRNMINEPCYRKLLKLFLMEFVEKEEDIIFLSNHTCIAKRKKCEECRFNQCNLPNVTRTRVTQFDKIKGCKTWCDKVFTKSKLFCLGFKDVGCQFLCNVVIDEMLKGCYWCCNEGNFYDKCVKPFENILDKMGGNCDPAFD